MSDRTQKVLEIWEIPVGTLSYFSTVVFLAISEDKQWWSGNSGQLLFWETGKTRTFGSTINKEHCCENWEQARQYIINVLMPSLETTIIYSPYNDLDRFSNLEE